MTRAASALITAGLFSMVTAAAAQTPPPARTPPTQTPPAQTPAKPAAPKRQVAAPKPTSIRISVHDDSGSALPDTRLVLSGGSDGEFTTGAAGTAIVPNLKPGTYRVRAEHDGFVPLEREFTLGTGAWNPIDLVLNAAPAPPPPPKPADEPKPVATSGPAGPPVSVSVPDFLDKNFIGGREPTKESVLACKPLETVRLLQLREPVAPHVHDRMDEVVYVVAGDGAVRIGEDVTAVRPGEVIVVPSGTRHGFERRGKNPLILVSTLTGAPCDAAK